MHLVEPHPLDYDWRYTQKTVDELLRFAARFERCLCIGAPSIARRLESAGRNVVLVDRQPIQGVRAQLRIDPSYDDPPADSYDLVYVDPPWYPEVLHRWVGWAAKVANRQATIVCSLWPASTRPNAPDEREQLFAWLAGWTDVNLTQAALSYEVPQFEAAAASLPAENLVGLRHGDRLELRPFGPVALPPPLPCTEQWHRFVFDQYQLALRVPHSDRRMLQIHPHPLAHGWTWPSVSRRAPGRLDIDLWSSRNEVAIVEGSPSLLSLLLSLRDRESLRQLLEVEPALQTLREWRLSALEFSRVMTWHHFN